MRYLLLALFVGMLGTRALGLDFGIAPGLSLKNAMLYAVFVLLAIETAVARNRQLAILTVIAPYTLLILYALITWVVIIMFSDDPNYSALETLIRLKAKLVDQFLVLLAFFYGCMRLKDAVWLATSVTWVVVLSCVLTVVDTFNVPNLGIVTTRDDDGRVEGLIGSSAEFASLLTFYLPTAAAIFLTTSGAIRSIAALGASVILFTIMLTATRGAMLGIVMGSIVAALYLHRFLSAAILTKVAVISACVLVAAASAIALTDFGQLLQMRLSTGLTTGDLESLSSGRTAIWLAALNDMATWPLSFITGFGWEAYYQKAGYRLATHNVYLDRFYSLGLIGLVLFIAIFANAVTLLRRSLADVSPHVAPYVIAAIVGICCYAVAMAFTDVDFSMTFVWAYVGLALRIALHDTERSFELPSATHGLGRAETRDQKNRATRAMSLMPRR